MKKANEYIKCPRCELNYIIKKDKFCDVCKSEMKAGILEENDFDDFEEGLELCPMCKVNYISEGETMCSTCHEEKVEGIKKDDDPDWRGYVEKADDEEEDLDLLPVEEDDDLDEEMKGAFAEDLDEGDFDEEIEEEEESFVEDDDFDDSYNDLDDDDFDDEEDDDEDEEDDDDDLF